jgi:hypothetical protein
MFRASFRPSSGGQTAFSLHMVIYPVVTCDVGESAGKLCAHVEEQLINNKITNCSSGWSHIYLHLVCV